ncbi:hypothetical protein ANN_09444 [Periplaneta americana]|uniref:Uncharacterized protein n=1 Tax=Periplaneta americana TaxID=6978 RepID=A0ABQ8TNW8_PERAM|nr:hypothetical protein ANN_09444 [Periplaneta americana]
MLSRNRDSLPCLGLMGNRECEQKTGLFLLKVRPLRTSAAEVHDAKAKAAPLFVTPPIKPVYHTSVSHRSARIVVFPSGKQEPQRLRCLLRRSVSRLESATSATYKSLDKQRETPTMEREGDRKRRANAKKYLSADMNKLKPKGRKDAERQKRAASKGWKWNFLAWFLQGEEHRLRVFENKVLGKIFWAKRDEVTGKWRKLHNTELHALYSSPDIIRNIKSRHLRWAGHVARMGESRNAYRVLVGRPEGKRPLGRPRRRWEDNIKMDLRDMMIENGLILLRIGTNDGLM